MNGQAGQATAPTNSAATGQPTITGTAEVGETLTAGTSGIADGNGTTNAVFTFQWIRSASGSDNDITDATGSTYVITNAEIDKAIKVRREFRRRRRVLGNPHQQRHDVSAGACAGHRTAGSASDCEAAGDVTLVSNTGQTTTTGAGLVVGSSLGNKSFTSTAVHHRRLGRVHAVLGPNLYQRFLGARIAARVSIYEADSSGKPSGSLYPLMNPGSVSNNSLNTFTAPANASLAKETKYLVVAEATSGSYQIGYTSSNAEDSGKANGWSINNRRHIRDSYFGSWSLSSVGCTNIRISVSGTITPSTDITVPNNWSRKPSGLGVGDEFRLIFLSSTKL